MLENTAQMPSRSSADVAPAPRRKRRVGNLDNRTWLARRVNELTESFVAALGGNPDGLTMAAVKNAAESMALTEAMRRDALRGRPVDPAILLRFQGVSDRALRRLGLNVTAPVPAAADTTATFQQRLAQIQAEADAAEVAGELNENRGGDVTESDSAAGELPREDEAP